MPLIGLGPADQPPCEFVSAVIFDTDGVVTDTATVHARAWKALFDEFLASLPSVAGEEHRPFTDDDYRRFVDGKPRFDGVASFLGSRGMVLPHGAPTDDENAITICGLGNAKNRHFREALTQQGVQAFDTTIALVESLRSHGVAVAVVSASENCAAVLEQAGVSSLFDVRVDGLDSIALGLPGKPDPAIYMEAARRLGVDPERAAIVEDAIAGVEAGRRGGFGLVIGVDRTGDGSELRRRGADVVVTDLSEIELTDQRPERPADPTTESSERRWEIGTSGDWRLIYGNFDPDEETLREALCTLGNGYFATRGAAPESTPTASTTRVRTSPASYNRAHQRGRWATGRPTRASSTSRTGFRWRSVGPGAWFDDHDAEVIAHRVELDPRRGLLVRRTTFEDRDGRRLALTQRRFVSMSDPHLAALETTILAENWTGPAGDPERTRRGRTQRRRGSLPRPRRRPSRHRRDELRHRRGHFVGGRDDPIAHSDRAGGADPTGARQRAPRRDAVARRRRSHRRPRVPRGARRGRGGHHREGRRHLHVTRPRHQRARRGGSRAGPWTSSATSTSCSIATRSSWRHPWRHSDIELGRDGELARNVHLHLFHLLQTVSNNTRRPRRRRAGPRPARRGLPRPHLLGRAVHLPVPQPPIPAAHPVAPALPLPSARPRRAAAPSTPGYAGAMYPWQSGSNGREETQHAAPQPRLGTLARRRLPPAATRQRGDRRTTSGSTTRPRGDIEFLRFHGAEMILEIARFWASAATYNRSLDRYEIKGVMGPDEYHDGYPDRSDTRSRQQRLHQRDGGVVPVPRPRGVGRPAARRRSGPVREPVVDQGRDRALGRDQPQDARVLPRRRHQPVRGLRGAGGARLERLPATLRRHRPARSHPRGRGRHAQPLQARQAGRCR